MSRPDPQGAPRGCEIAMRGVAKHYGAFVAIRHVDLLVRAGEFLTFLGPSGGGKTTTLNLLAGFGQPTAGEIIFDGRHMEGEPSHRRNIGMVFQHYALFPHMTVGENVAYPLVQRRVPAREREQRVAAILERVGLKGFDRRRPAQLSGGQQQRVALARAMVYRPRILLMDEPLGALDKALREELQVEIRRIHRDTGSTTIYVTHDQEEALVLSDRIAVFNGGRIEQLGTPHELYEAPRTLFVGSFLGESTVFRGRSTPRSACGLAKVEGAFGSALARTGGGAGSDVAILVRPELQRLSRRAELAEGVNVVPCTVDDCIFVGAGWKVRVVLADGTAGVVRTTGRAREEFAPGDRAWISWDVASGVLLADTPSAPTAGGAGPPPHG